MLCETTVTGKSLSVCGFVSSVFDRSNICFATYKFMWTFKDLPTGLLKVWDGDVFRTLVLLESRGDIRQGPRGFWCVVEILRGGISFSSVTRMQDRVKFTYLWFLLLNWFTFRRGLIISNITLLRPYRREGIGRDHIPFPSTLVRQVRVHAHRHSTVRAPIRDLSLLYVCGTRINPSRVLHPSLWLSIFVSRFS